MSATCDMKRDCTNPVTHIGEKGYIYCAEHAPERRGWERCRKMRAWELKLIRAGEPLPSYRPILKPLGDTQHRGTTITDLEKIVDNALGENL